MLHLNRQWLCIATTNGFLRIYDLSRRPEIFVSFNTLQRGEARVSVEACLRKPRRLLQNCADSPQRCGEQSEHHLLRGLCICAGVSRHRTSFQNDFWCGTRSRTPSASSASCKGSQISSFMRFSPLRIEVQFRQRQKLPQIRANVQQQQRLGLTALIRFSEKWRGNSHATECPSIDPAHISGTRTTNASLLWKLFILTRTR